MADKFEYSVGYLLDRTDKLEINKINERVHFVGILDIFKSKATDNDSENERLILSKEEKYFLDTVTVGLWSGEKINSKDVNSLSIDELLGKVSYCIPDKRYELAEKLLNIAEKKSDNVIDLHFIYNSWIELTYKQREKDSYLERCKIYCVKDVLIFPVFIEEWKDARSRIGKSMKKVVDKIERKAGEKYRESGEQLKAQVDDVFDIYIPAFERLAIIYEKQGNVSEAIEICEMAIGYGLKDSTKGGFEGRLEKLQKKLNK